MPLKGNGSSVTRLTIIRCKRKDILRQLTARTVLRSDMDVVTWFYVVITKTYDVKKNLQRIILIFFIMIEGSMTIMCETKYRPNARPGFGGIPLVDGPYFQ